MPLPVQIGYENIPVNTGLIVIAKKNTGRQCRIYIFSNKSVWSITATAQVILHVLLLNYAPNPNTTFLEINHRIENSMAVQFV